MRSAGTFRIDPVEFLYLAVITIGFVVPAIESSGGTRPPLIAPSTAALLIGAAVAVLVGGALRSGARGAALYVSAPFVFFVLLAPGDRGLALRRPVLSHLASAAVIGAVLGLAVSLLVARWVGVASPGLAASGLLCGAAVSIACSAAGLIAAGRKMRSAHAWVMSAILLAWSGVDAVTRRVTSPMGAVGQLAVNSWRLADLVMIGLTAATLVVLALRWIGGLSIEGLGRRSETTSSSRLSMAMNDARWLLVTRRTLHGERFRTGATPRPPDRLHAPAILRVWWGTARWPLRMWGRVGAAAIAAGLLLPLRSNVGALAIGGIAMYLAAFELSEALGQLADHAGFSETIAADPARTRVKIVAATAPLFVLWSGVVTIIGSWLHSDAVGRFGPAVVAASLVALAATTRSICRPVQLLVGPDDVRLSPEALGARVMFAVGAPMVAPVLTYVLISATVLPQLLAAMVSLAVGVAAVLTAMFFAVIPEPLAAARGVIERRFFG